jgi:hypothetical protein
MATITKFTKVSPVRFQISFNGSVMHENNERDNTIYELYDDDGRIVTIGDPFYIPSQGWFRVNHIRKERNVNTYYIISDLRTDTSILMLALIHTERDSFWGYDKFMLNAYDRVIDCPLDNRLYVTYRIPKNDTDDTAFSEYHRGFHNIPQYLGVKHKTVDHVTYMFKMPSEHINDLKMFRESKFSRMSDLAKDKIYTFHRKNVEIVRKFKDEFTLNKGLRAKMEKEYNISIPFDAELRSSIYPDKETFDPNTLITDVRD